MTSERIEKVGILFVILLFLIPVMISMATSVNGMLGESVASESIPTQPGTPLDAVRVNAPSFADGKVCYKVMDRGTEKVWYMVQMRSQNGGLEWVVFPE